MPFRPFLARAAAAVALCATTLVAASPLEWPVLTRQSRPWSYWWWMASAVDAPNLTRELEQLRQAGWGGVHIIPIYGAKGYEPRYIDYLSPKWMEMLRHTVTEAEKRGMGVDMTTGTGWCFGGPNITPELASVTVQAKPPDYAISLRPAARVKRAAPGGAGYMLNPFYGAALKTYLEPFDRAFAAYTGPKPRAMYHDSFEYGANWSPDLLAEFERRRGYRLQDQLAALVGQVPDLPANRDHAARVKSDYRETLSDLALENFTRPWVEWCHARGFIARNEAHGSPGNLLDLYATADVPESEMFFRDRSSVVTKFAASAAHVAGRALVANETGTWLAEHFQETLAGLKDLIDQLFLAGVNHVIYHGTCYSPADAPWPGWLFYASTQLNSRNAIWHDVPALNQYIARAQSLLQSGRSDNDLLLYWPVYDVWHNPAGMAINMTVHQRAWVEEQAFGRMAQTLLDRGYSFDYISDRQLQTISAGTYRAIVVPRTEHMPVETMERLRALARSGMAVIFSEQLPADVPGLARLEQRRAALRKLTEGLRASEVAPALEAAGVRREALVDHAGLSFIRRASQDGPLYFIANRGKQTIDEWVPLAAESRGAALLDPMTGRAGVTSPRRRAKGGVEVHLQLEPGESVFVRLAGQPLSGPPWTYRRRGGKEVPLSGTWNVRFLDGGPELPAAFRTGRLGTWTTASAAAERFAGTARYSLRFDTPAAGDWWLDLGRVAESARVRLDSRDLGTVFSPPFRVLAEGLKRGSHLLEIDVTNLSANRIRDLDRRKTPWKIFHDINIVNIDYKPFDASNWPVRDSGLLGPVVLREAAKLR